MEVANTPNTNEISAVQIGNDRYYKISNSDALRPFFMSIVSDSDHWMFIASNGGLSAGRKNSEYALFPYYTDDKITESVENTGSKSIFLVHRGEQSQIWEPFSDRYEGRYKITRNLYKSVYGNSVLFEEENHDLQLVFRYEWSSSDHYGFVRTAKLINKSEEERSLSLLDGLQNILPYGVSTNMQTQTSNLVDAYKRSELEESAGMGIYALSAIIVDKAEPSEALKANVVWSLGFENPNYLLSSLQLKQFRKGMTLQTERDVKAERGAYFINKDITLGAGAEKQWMIVANVNQNHAAIAKLADSIASEQHLEQVLKQDIADGTQRLIELDAAADGLQLTSDQLKDTRHFSNVLFNIMRGGIFDHNYEIEKWDFEDYLSKANKDVFAQLNYGHLPEVFLLSDLRQLTSQSEDKRLRRLCIEYMPLKFSRRHGDPSRPWNRFSINTRNEVDGTKILDYEGNWRDIFQNWEALAYSYPEFVESMIHKFLNATTFDGYNPYRVTKDGFDWETIEPDNPWSYIGYWGDHQIIYLLKLLECFEKHYPGKLVETFDEDYFVYANVPYRIKDYEDILKNPKDTIEFDAKSDKAIRKRREAIGADGALLLNTNNEIHTVNFIEKILATVLAKLANFIPEGGIWMNTQRPEWNDANNALVGNGVSMVTLCYLNRFLIFFNDLFSASTSEKFEVSNEIAVLFGKTLNAFERYEHLLRDGINDESRRQLLNELGEANSRFRILIYDQAFSGSKQSLHKNDLTHFITLSQRFLEATIRVNRRSDDLYHAYNLMTVEDNNEVSVSHLSEMLEGQVAVLSSGYLSSEEALNILDALKNSSLFREDQYSYILYPNKELPLFKDKNNIPINAVDRSSLLQQLLVDNHTGIIEIDINGHYHFNGNFKNANDLKAALDQLSRADYIALVAQEKELILQIFEEVFNHKAFTGRSGTFFGYEGLGSIYWHMVSKLQLAVQECCLKAIEEGASEEVIGKLLEHYYEINEGIGVHKSPSLYGAFPTDPYSHTPAGKGAQQPGMTGQVKEDILCRFGELGVFVKEGRLSFNPCLLRRSEFLQSAQVFEYIDPYSQQLRIELASDSLCFTYCQVPVVYKIAETDRLEIIKQNGETISSDNLSLDLVTSKQLFERTGEIIQINVELQATQLK